MLYTFRGGGSPLLCYISTCIQMGIFMGVIYLIWILGNPFISQKKKKKKKKNPFK